MNQPRQFIEKTIRMRERMICLKRSHRSDMECYLAIRSLKPWLEAYPNASDRQVAAHLARHKYAVLTLLPGGDAPNAQSMQSEFQTILNQYQYAPAQS